MKTKEIAPFNQNDELKLICRWLGSSHNTSIYSHKHNKAGLGFYFYYEKIGGGGELIWNLFNWIFLLIQEYKVVRKDIDFLVMGIRIQHP